MTESERRVRQFLETWDGEITQAALKEWWESDGYDARGIGHALSWLYKLKREYQPPVKRDFDEEKDADMSGSQERHAAIAKGLSHLRQAVALLGKDNVRRLLDDILD